MTDVLARFHRTLVDEIREQRPEYLTGPFTVAEIYQNLVPYGTHRDRIGVEMNGDYEDALLRLLAGEGDYLVLESEPALRDLREELDSSNPNTGLYREFAAVDVRLNQARLDPATAGATFAGPPRTGDGVRDGTGVAPATDPHAAAGSRSIGAAATVEADEAEDPPTRPTPTPAPAEVPGADGGDVAAPAREASAAESADDTVTCRWCRAALPERASLNFCPFCGTDVHVVPCPSCGEELDPDWRFCISCGTEVAE